MASIKEYEVRVTGRVQGIRFRKTVKDFAERNNLKGFASNVSDGSVLVTIQGSENSLNSFVSWLKTNPGFSKIKDVKFIVKPVSESYSDFRIIKDSGFVEDKAKGFINLAKSIAGVDQSLKIPRHVAIIPDGNRRWARRRGLRDTSGHYHSGSMNNIMSLFNEAKILGIEYISLWVFSTENWKRSPEEIKSIFDIISTTIDSLKEKSSENNICFKWVGRRDRIPAELMNLLINYEKITKNNSGLKFHLCFDYGGRDEIVRAVNKIIKSKEKSVNEISFRKFLDTAGIPDPDLVIRTGGEKRLSGFMLYQAAYSELYFTDLFFPDFNAAALRKCVEDFGRRQRRFGGN